MINMPPYFGTVYSREHDPVIFTSNPYPYYYEDSFRVEDAGINGGRYYQSVFGPDNYAVGSVTIQGATLTETIRYISYVPPYFDQFFIKGAEILSGTLQVTIAYKSVTMPPDDYRVGGVSIQGGTLNTVIVYLTYNMTPESFNLGGVSITEATLS